MEIATSAATTRRLWKPPRRLRLHAKKCKSVHAFVRSLEVFENLSEEQLFELSDASPHVTGRIVFLP